MKVYLVENEFKLDCFLYHYDIRRMSVGCYSSNEIARNYINESLKVDLSNLDTDAVDIQHIEDGFIATNKVTGKQVQYTRYIVEEMEVVEE